METTPQGVADTTIYRAIRGLQSRGVLPLDQWTNKAAPLTGLGLEHLDALFNSAPARTSPAFPGAVDPSEGYRGMLNEHLSNYEGREDRAYHGAFSSHRKKEKFVSDGHGSTEEVDVGFGFNMARPGARDAFKAALGTDDKLFDDVFNGRKALNVEQETRLRDADVKSLDDWLTQRTNGFRFTNPERAALLSIGYNAGQTALAKSGILDLAMTDPRAAAAAIKSFRTSNGRLSARRLREATLFLGGDAPSILATNQ